MNNRANKFIEILNSEIIKSNNFKYEIQFSNLILIINTKNLYQILVNNCIWFGGYIDSESIFDYNQRYDNFFFSDEKILSKIKNIPFYQNNMHFPYPFDFNLKNYTKQILKNNYNLKLQPSSI